MKKLLYENQPYKQTYKPTFDVINISACIAVVILHVNGAVWGGPYGRFWVTSLILECVFYWAVPVFFMISGATLMDYRQRYDTKTFFKRRFSKTLIPFLFWSFVSIFWAIFLKHTLPTETLTDWRDIVDAVLDTKGFTGFSYHCLPYICVFRFYPVFLKQFASLYLDFPFCMHLSVRPAFRYFSICYLFHITLPLSLH